MNTNIGHLIILHVNIRDSAKVINHKYNQLALNTIKTRKYI